MKAENILRKLIKSLVAAGLFNDEETALKALTADYIDRKIVQYREIIKGLEERHKESFQEFSKSLEGKATPELEEDWMEWKSAQVMLEAWNKVLKEILIHAG